MVRIFGRLLVTALALGAVATSSPAQTGGPQARGPANATANATRAAGAKPPSYTAGKGTDGGLFWVSRDGVPTLVGVGTTPPVPRRATRRAPAGTPSPTLQSDLERWAAHWGPDAEPVPEPPRYEREPAVPIHGVPLSWVYGRIGYPYAYPSYPFYSGYFRNRYSASGFFPQHYQHPYTRHRINRFSRPYPRLPFRSAPGYPPHLRAPGLRRH
jgi:hypothetical protein